jgi:hypothetical protein
MNPQLIDRRIEAWRFALPIGFLRALGYLQLTEKPRRYVGLYWSPDELLSCDDGLSMFTGFLQHREWLDYFCRPEIAEHVRNRGLDFGSADSPAWHWFLVDRGRNVGYTAGVEIAWRVVRIQRLYSMDRTPELMEAE